MSSRARDLVVLGFAALLCAFCGCGSARHDPVVARVGTTTVDGAAVAHWISVLAPRHVVPGAADGAELQTLRHRALEFLISTAWLTGEAARQGTPVTQTDVRAVVAQRERSLGHAEFASSLAAVGQTPADFQLETRRQLAASKVARRVRASVRAPSAAEVGRYYRDDAARFRYAERRWFYIVEAIPTARQARAMMREFVDGRKRISEPGTSLYEQLDRPRDMRRARTIVKALFAARLHAVTGPVDVNGQFFVVYVTRVRPRFALTLAQARSQIESKLLLARRRAAIERFAESWRWRWTGVTSCERGYVVQQCRQFRGARAEGDPFEEA